MRPLSGSPVQPAGYDAILTAPFGSLGIRTTPDALAEIRFLPACPSRAPQNTLAERAARVIEAYFADPEYRFDLPLVHSGTAFQQRIRAAIAAIPCRQTRTYGDIARALGSAARAVGQACGANPFPIVVPCHRVVSASGLGGFAHAREGALLDTKTWLLRHEGAL